MGVPPQMVPPIAYGIVEDGVYRSNALTPANFPFIKNLNLTTVIRLSPEVPMAIETKFFEENKIHFVHLGLKAWRQDATWSPVTDELMKEALELILNPDTHPVLVECTSGIHQTGTLVGCLRRLLGWNLASIINEYRAFAGAMHTRFMNEQFIELFDTDLITLPARLPHWFLIQRQCLEEQEKSELKSSGDG